MEQLFQDSNLLVIVLMLLPVFIFCFALYHLFNNEELETHQKIIWLVVIFLFHFIGSLIYLNRHNRKSKSL